ncbi:MAG: DUF58 domain-containing protein [Planctomycetia bacterium]|nr:DUF58 domain-containing protein [Planctomycetia bacterium]
MIPLDARKKVRQLQFMARRAVHELLGGEYHSAFKGTGIAFDEVRPYQPGDDVRGIDWNVTARMDAPFVKRYIEERERTVVLVLDASASLDFGTGSCTKRDAAAEVAALLAFSALANNDRIGLLLSSDRIERFVPPIKGQRHALRIIRDILFFRPQHRGTSLAQGLDHLNRVLPRRAIVFLLSDFLDRDFERPLKRTAQRHELIAVHLSDPREHTLPCAGLVHLADAETGRRLLVNTTSPALSAGYRTHAVQRTERLKRITRGAGIDLVEVSTDGEHIETLIRFFRSRRTRKGPA